MSYFINVLKSQYMSEKANSDDEVSSLILTGKGNILFNKLKYATQLKYCAHVSLSVSLIKFSLDRIRQGNTFNSCLAPADNGQAHCLATIHKPQIHLQQKRHQ